MHTSTCESAAMILKIWPWLVFVPSTHDIIKEDRWCYIADDIYVKIIMTVAIGDGGWKEWNGRDTKEHNWDEQDCILHTEAHEKWVWSPLHAMIELVCFQCSGTVSHWDLIWWSWWCPAWCWSEGNRPRPGVWKGGDALPWYSEGKNQQDVKKTFASASVSTQSKPHNICVARMVWAKALSRATRVLGLWMV